MDIKRLEDVKDTAIKLNVIHTQYPEYYFYLKGWIHCLLQKEAKARNEVNLKKQEKGVGTKHPVIITKNS